jgi:hypothetical protein
MRLAVLPVDHLRRGTRHRGQGDPDRSAGHGARTGSGAAARYRNLTTAHDRGRRPGPTRALSDRLMSVAATGWRQVVMTDGVTSQLPSVA